MMLGYAWAKNPLVKRIDQIDPKLPITLLYGSRTWVDHSAEVLKEKRVDVYFKLHVSKSEF